MAIAYWVVAGLLAAAFLGAGLFKLTTPKDALRAKGLAWVEDFSAAGVRGIAAAEVLGAVGLLVPPLTGIAPVLAPVAAAGLLLLMALATRVHARRGEPVAPTLVLAGLAAAATALGFLVWL